MRNRIVSGLCKGIVVVEAPLASGTLITVDQALDQGRTVMAVPGRVDSPASQGCHKLLRAGARLVTTADEIADEIQELVPRSADRPRPREAAADAGQPLAPESPDERRLLAEIGPEETHIDSVIHGSGLPAGLVNALLVGLQIKRRVKLLPGGMVKRVL
jgi:DNA processing protein